MLTLHARLKAQCEFDLRRKTPSTFPDPNSEHFPADYFLYNLFRKEEPFAEKAEVPVSVLRDSLSKFTDSEWRCRVVNICGRFTSPICIEDQIFFREAIRLARSWISNVMMDRWPRWEDACYTSGASRNSSRQRSMSYLKTAGYSESGKMSGTKSAQAIVAREIAPCFGPHWPYARVEIVNDCRFDFVHKTAKSVRFMALQPEYNLLTQQCVGDCIRAALLPFGINLNDQTPNQKLAYHGSVTREIATIDLSNSSDNIAMQHGEMFLSPRLFEMCMATRVTHVSVDAVKHRLEKLAPMGNGFIFELQSLIYAGLAHAVTRLKGGRECDIAVFGDDIVVSTECAMPLMDLLIHLGMEPNLDKSYWGETPFRESCGKHYLAGRDVTPFYVKAPLQGLRSLFRAVNGLNYWQQRTGLKIENAIKLLAKQIPKKDRLIVPRTFSIDAGLHFLVSGCTLPKRTVNRYGELMLNVEALMDKTQDIRERLEDDVLYLDWLNQPPRQLITNDVWRKLQARLHPTCWNSIHGMPIERKTYRRVLDVETHPADWVSLRAYPVDAA